MFNVFRMRAKAAKLALLTASALSFALVGAAANAAPTITNGNFSSSATDSFIVGFGPLSGWTVSPVTSGVNCIDVGGLSDICGAAYNSPATTVWKNPGVAPGGGNAFVSDVEMAETLSQTVSGLTVGTSYAITFAQASSYIFAAGGASTEDWAVSLGGTTVSSPTMVTPSDGGTPWNLVTVDFTATSASETLSFLAQGTPVGGPPTAFLGDVSIAVAVPEPAAAAIFGLSVLGLLGLYKTRSRISSAI